MPSFLLFSLFWPVIERNLHNLHFLEMSDLESNKDLSQNSSDWPSCDLFTGSQEIQINYKIDQIEKEQRRRF